jgi:ATP synthase protein I
MADGTRNTGERKEPPSDEEAALSARLRRLNERLEKTSRPSERISGSPQADASGFARGFRLSTEMVGGVLVGGGFGWLIDRWLGTSPWGFILLLLLGFAAGVLNVMRAAGVVRERHLDD